MNHSVLQLLLSHSTISPFFFSPHALIYFANQMEPAEWSACASSNFLFTTSAAGFSGRLAGHLAGKIFSISPLLQAHGRDLNIPQFYYSFIFQNLLTPLQGHMELEAYPSMHWAERGDTLLTCRSLIHHALKKRTLLQASRLCVPWGKPWSRKGILEYALLLSSLSKAHWGQRRVPPKRKSWLKATDVI